jgi:hypothetical protein
LFRFRQMQQSVVQHASHPGQHGTLVVTVNGGTTISTRTSFFAPPNGRPPLRAPLLCEVLVILFPVVL